MYDRSSADLLPPLPHSLHLRSLDLTSQQTPLPPLPSPLLLLLLLLIINSTIGYALENKADAETHSSLTKLIARHSEKLRIPTSPASLQQAVDTFYNALVDEAKTKAAAKQAPAPATHSQSRYAETPEDDDEGTTTTSTSATGAVHQSSGYGVCTNGKDDESDNAMLLYWYLWELYHDSICLICHVYSSDIVFLIFFNCPGSSLYLTFIL